jgi:hypothetical protein
MALSGDADATNLRQRMRYEVVQEIEARFNGQPVRLIDIGIGGFQIEHESPVRLGIPGTVTIASEETFECSGRVAWSRYEVTGYRSGVRIESDIERVAPQLGRFLHAYGRPIARSPELRNKSREASRSGVLTTARDDGQPAGVRDEARAARATLAESPDEALKWYNRARYALAAGIITQRDVAFTPHRDEVLAVWEFLGRRYAVREIAEAFEEL